MRFLRWLAIGAALAAQPGVMAHTDDYLDKMEAPHGGQVRMAGALHLELVLKPGEVVVYVTDHGQQAISTEGARGTATVHTGDASTRVKLAPTGENALKGSGDFGLGSGMKVTVAVTLPGQETATASFDPLKEPATGTRHDQHKH